VKITRTANKYVFQLGKREKRLLFDLLQLYPCVPSTHQRLSKSKLPDREANQHLLDEALAEHRAENKKQLLALLSDPRRSKETESGHRLALSEADLEWLLQILNDIRVGSWLLLGAPELKLDFGGLNARNAPHFWAMEMAGQFQMQFIEALGSDSL